MKSVGILLVEDDPVWRDCIEQYLSREEDIYVIGSAGTKAEALEHFQDADIVLMDINLTGNNLDGIDLTAEMNRIKPTRIIMLTVMDDKDVILNAFNAGAIHYVSKTNFRDLPIVIRSVMQNSKPFKLLLDDYARLKRATVLKDLTPAEREIFELLEQGCPQRIIGNKLHKAESTIKNQISNILKKMNVRTCKQAIEKVKKGY